VLGVRCSECDLRGQIVSAFGWAASPEEAVLLRALAERRAPHDA
jgi:hypothetical protein